MKTWKLTPLASFIVVFSFIVVVISLLAMVDALPLVLGSVAATFIAVVVVLMFFSPLFIMYNTQKTYTKLSETNDLLRSIAWSLKKIDLAAERMESEKEATPPYKQEVPSSAPSVPCPVCAKPIMALPGTSDVTCPHCKTELSMH